MTRKSTNWVAVAIRLLTWNHRDSSDRSIFLFFSFSASPHQMTHTTAATFFLSFIFLLVPVLVVTYYSSVHHYMTTDCCCCIPRRYLHTRTSIYIYPVLLNSEKLHVCVPVCLRVSVSVCVAVFVCACVYVMSDPPNILDAIPRPTYTLFRNTWARHKCYCYYFC